MRKLFIFLLSVFFTSLLFGKERIYAEVELKNGSKIKGNFYLPEGVTLRGIRLIYPRGKKFFITLYLRRGRVRIPVDEIRFVRRKFRPTVERAKEEEKTPLREKLTSPTPEAGEVVLDEQGKRSLKPGKYRAILSTLPKEGKVKEIVLVLEKFPTGDYELGKIVTERFVSPSTGEKQEEKQEEKTGVIKKTQLFASFTSDFRLEGFLYSIEEKQVKKTEMEAVVVYLPLCRFSAKVAEKLSFDSQKRAVPEFLKKALRSYRVYLSSKARYFYRGNFWQIYDPRFHLRLKLVKLKIGKEVKPALQVEALKLKVKVKDYGWRNVVKREGGEGGFSVIRSIREPEIKVKEFSIFWHPSYTLRTMAPLQFMIERRMDLSALRRGYVLDLGKMSLARYFYSLDDRSFLEAKVPSSIKDPYRYMEYVKFLKLLKHYLRLICRYTYPGGLEVSTYWWIRRDNSQNPLGRILWIRDPRSREIFYSPQFLPKKEKKQQ